MSKTAEEMARAWVEQLGDSAPIGVISKAYLQALESLRLADQLIQPSQVDTPKRKVLVEKYRKSREGSAPAGASGASDCADAEGCRHDFQPESRTWDVCTKCGERE